MLVSASHRIQTCYEIKDFLTVNKILAITLTNFLYNHNTNYNCNLRDIIKKCNIKFYKKAIF